MNISHADNLGLTQISQISQRQVASPLLPSGMQTFDEVDKLRALIAMQPFREICEICVRQKESV